jgi:hypothetical protein
VSRLLRLLAVLVLVSHAAFGTIIIAVGTSDGLLLCEDRRLTIKSDSGQVSSVDGNKAEQLGKFGFFAITGEVSGGLRNIFGQSVMTFDVRSEIPAFFKTHDIQQFNEQMAGEFETHLWDELKKKPVSAAQRTQELRAQTEVLLYWMDQSGHTRLYILDMMGNLPDGNGPATPETATPPHLVGRLISLALFKTSKPLVRGKGLLGYNAIAAGTDPGLDDVRQDDELKLFLSNFVDAASIDSIAATRSIKKLIRLISERQNSISADGLDVGPVSDCFLGTPDGIKNINQY